MKRDTGGQYEADTVNAKESSKRSGVWTYLYLLKKRSPSSWLFWIFQYFIMYLQIILWPITKVESFNLWGSSPLFNFLQLVANFFCGASWTPWNIPLILTLVLVPVHSFLFFAGIINTKIRENKHLCRWIAIYMGFASRSLLIVAISNSLIMAFCRDNFFFI